MVKLFGPAQIIWVSGGFQTSRQDSAGVLPGRTFPEVSIEAAQLSAEDLKASPLLALRA
jgi:hypothetical protein